MSSSALSQPTLVLNRSWFAIATTSVRHALVLVYTGAAKAIRTDTFEVHGFESWARLEVRVDEPHVCSVDARIPIPEVVVLQRFNSVPRQRVAFSRRNLTRRDRNLCQYCGRRPRDSELSIDHVLPRSRGGSTSWENCVLACAPCNRRKADRLPREVGLKLLKKPAQPPWSPIHEVPLGRVRPSWERFLPASERGAAGA